MVNIPSFSSKNNVFVVLTFDEGESTRALGIPVPIPFSFETSSHAFLGPFTKQNMKPVEAFFPRHHAYPL
jgi:hypothetical protein